MEIQVIRNVFKRNDALAAETRAMLDRSGVVAFNLIGSAGSGKTALLEVILPVLATSARVAVLEGDITTTRDAERIAKLGVRVIQLTTEGGCHLSAALVHEGMKQIGVGGLNAVFIENVGNLVCPASFDIGEHVRVAVLSCTEGDDKPAKYPLIFKTAHLVVLSKSDLAAVSDFDTGRATQYIRMVNPTVPILVVSARTREGIGTLTEWLGDKIHAKASPGTPSPRA